MMYKDINCLVIGMVAIIYDELYIFIGTIEYRTHITIINYIHINVRLGLYSSRIANAHQSMTTDENIGAVDGIMSL